MQDACGTFSKRRVRKPGNTCLPATSTSILLVASGVERVTVTDRDPADALVSWWHQMYQYLNDPRSAAWHKAMMTASGIIRQDFYDLPKPVALDSLIETYLPALLNWRESWSNEKRVDVHVIQFEDIVSAPEEAVAAILGHHEVAFDNVVLPDKDGTTNYRRGTIGSHRDEMTPEQIARVEEATNRWALSDTYP